MTDTVGKLAVAARDALAADHLAAEAPSGDNLDAALAAQLEELIATGDDHILKYFRWRHLQKPDLRARSALFGTLAMQLVTGTPRNPERTVALRKLLESKDAAVRAMLP